MSAHAGTIAPSGQKKLARGKERRAAASRRACQDTSSSERAKEGGWPVVPLAEIAEIKLGKMLDKTKHKTGQRLPYLRNVNVRWGTIETDDLLEMNFEEDQLERFGLRANDVLVCEGGEPGRASVWNGHLPDLKFQKALHRVRFNVPYEPRLLLPDGWTWATLDQLHIYLRNGWGLKPDAETGTPILRISANRPMSVNLEDVRFLSGSPNDYAEYFVAEGDLLFTRYNGNPSLTGVCGVVPPLDTKIVHPDKLIRVRVVPKLCVSKFVGIMVNVGTSRDFLASRARTTAGQTGISGSDLRGMPIPIPPLAEQTRILAEVERRLSVAEELSHLTDHSVRRSERLRQFVLSRAFIPPTEKLRE